MKINNNTMTYYSAPALKESIQFRRKPQNIIDKICDHFNVTPLQLMSKRRDRDLVFARHLAIYLIVTKTRMTLYATAKLFNRDHTTAIYAKRMIENYIETNSFNKREEIEQFINQL